MPNLTEQEFHEVVVTDCEYRLAVTFKKANGGYDIRSSHNVDKDDSELSNKLMICALSSFYSNLIDGQDFDEFMELFADNLRNMMVQNAMNKAKAENDKFIEICRGIIKEFPSNIEKNKRFLNFHCRSLFRTNIDESLIRNQIYTIGDLVRVSKEDLLSIKGIGKAKVNKVIELLGDFGLRLGMTDEEIDAWIISNTK
ncbi:MAG: hypothetical protein KBT28_10790 [Bacteroidales bacterium]|nr:hypothetical protein [Candidatus Colimorpha merdihippi]